VGYRFLGDFIWSGVYLDRELRLGKVIVEKKPENSL
jgi:hypothetical protein